MTTGSIKRSLVRTLLNTGTIAAPTWSIIGDGVTDARVEYNPKVTEETYIHQDGATKSVDSYSPTLPISSITINGDAVFEFIDALRKSFALLDDAVTEIVNVWLYETAYQGYYVAERQPVAIQIDGFGGPGGSPNLINYTLLYAGDVILGSFHPTDLAFVDNPVLATLATLSVGGHELTPVFAADQLWYTLDVVTATDTLSSTADHGDAVIVMEVDAVGVDEGNDATWEEGDNVLIVEVTVGTEVVEYNVLVTYTIP